MPRRSTPGRGAKIVLDTAFLGGGDWSAEIFRDAADSDTVPTHYIHESGLGIKSGAKKLMRMAPGGGFVVKFTK